MKKIKIYLLLIIAIIALIYASNITAIPDSLILFQGETLQLNTVLGIQIKEKNSQNEEIVEASSSLNEKNIISEETGEVELELSLLGSIPLKK